MDVSFYYEIFLQHLMLTDQGELTYSIMYV